MPSGSVAAIRESSSSALTPSHRRTSTPVIESALAGEQLLRSVGVEGDVGDAADLFGLAVGRQTDDGHGDRLRREHGGLVADGQVRPLGGCLVDHDLAARLPGRVRR